jgi:hypothetical protein
MQVRTFNYNSKPIDTVTMDVDGFSAALRINDNLIDGEIAQFHFTDLNELVDFIVCAKITLDTAIKHPKVCKEITNEDIEKMRIYVGGIWTPEGE